MKIDWNKKYNTIAMYSFIVAASIIIFYLSISQLGLLSDKISVVIAVLQPFIMGFVFAYLLNFILQFYKNRIFSFKIFEKYHLKEKKGLNIILTYITALILVGLFIKFVLPQLIDSIIGLVNNIPTYINSVNDLIYELVNKLDIEEEYTNMIIKNFNGLIDSILMIAKNLLPVIGGLLASVASSIWNIVLGIIISIYLLIDKEKLCALNKKITYALLPKKYADKTIELVHRSNDTFGKFLSGKIVDSAIIGVLTFIILTVFKMPYVLLVSVIVGITNIIPFFGPFIGAVPSFIIILFVSPIQALWFLVIILVIQQIDGNIIGPKILGDSIGISAFWILFSILVAGKLLGLVGMIIGVPLFAVVYSIIKEIVEGLLKKKGLKTETKDYL